MRSASTFLLLFLLSILLCIQCASEAAPGGGPPDQTPPFLTDANIISGSTLIPNDYEIVFLFSENLNPDISKKSVTIFPLEDNRANIRIKGKKLFITPNKPWDEKIVYTLILGKSISDMRGNTLEEPLQISFSSGPVIPANRIIGKVNGLQENTTAVIAISRYHERPDSILLFPEYYTQSGPDGDFSFEYLPAEKFYIAAYVDMDKSNSFKASFDGYGVPSQSSILPDSAGPHILVQAYDDNFAPGGLIKATGISASQTELVFQKELAGWNFPERFRIESVAPDSMIIQEKTCLLFHPAYLSDSIRVSFEGLQDHLGVSIPDSTFDIGVKPYQDSLYVFKTIGTHLHISPPPSAPVLWGDFRAATDTMQVELVRSKPGFYKIPGGSSLLRGNLLLKIPADEKYLFMNSDTVYSISLELKPRPEFGRVLGLVETSFKNVRIVLFNTQHHYEQTVRNNIIEFDKVLPGTYELAYYLDTNENERRDSGHPYPFRRPEFLFMLDTGIDVRARWDTDLEEPYKIVIENQS